jgi:hypothetical protein
MKTIIRILIAGILTFVLIWETIFTLAFFGWASHMAGL